MRYRFHVICPGCGKDSEIVSSERANPRVSCGDCLMDKVEVVEMKVVSVVEESDAQQLIDDVAEGIERYGDQFFDG